MSLKKTLFMMTLISVITAALLSAVSVWILAEISSGLDLYGMKIVFDGRHAVIKNTAPQEDTESPVNTVPQENTADSENRTVQGNIAAGSEIQDPRGEYLLQIIFALQIILPVLFFVSALLAAVFLFYRWKLKTPLEILMDGANHIMENDLDFAVEVQSDDELGKLCAAFERMRQALLKNSRELWRQAEERKRLNAAFSHDLRNPVTVLKGSAKMARQCAGGKEHTGQLMENLKRIEDYTERIEQYVEVMSSVGRLEQLQIKKMRMDPQVLSRELEDAVRLMAADSGKQIIFTETHPACRGETNAPTTTGETNEERFAASARRQSEFPSACRKEASAPATMGEANEGRFASSAPAAAGADICVDRNVLLQITENLVSNALRFARKTVMISLSFDDNRIMLEVTDDGCGFPASILKNGIQPFQKGTEEADHFGMGLYICDLLCKKHGGYLEIWNQGQGAAVDAALNIL